MPSGFSAVRTTPQSITLSWSDPNTPPAAGFDIERHAKGQPTVHFYPTASHYTDAGVSALTTYTYKVRTKNKDDVSAYSPPVTVKALPPTTPSMTPLPPPPTPPETPSGLASGDITPQSVVLTWTDHDPRATGFEIQRRSDGGLSASLPVGASPYTDAGLAPQTHYTYQVRAVDQKSGRRSDYSAAIGITTAAPPPPPVPPPTLLSGRVIHRRGILLTWQTAQPVDSFEVQRTDPQGVVGVLPVQTSPYLDRKVIGGQTYVYQVRAVQQGRRSDWSASVTVLDPAEATLTANTNLLDFGQVVIGTPNPRIFRSTVISRSVLRRVSITNPGEEAVQVQVAGPSAPFRLMSGGSQFSLAPGQSQVLVITFMPTAAGPFEDSLRITDSDGDTLQTVTLRGTGRPNLILNPDPIKIIPGLLPQNTIPKRTVPKKTVPQQPIPIQ